MIDKKILEMEEIGVLLEKYPFVEDFLKNNLIDVSGHRNSKLKTFFETLSEDHLEERAIDPDELTEGMVSYINQMVEFLGLEDNSIDKITIFPGKNKLGEIENFEAFDISKGEIICIVGPTGSGKSRLLADIEWTAQGDTPTKRTVHVNGRPADKANRFSSGNRLVAQLSQNMNFVMDLTVFEFLQLHAQSRMVENEEEVIEKIIAKSNDLAGEKFSPDTPITSLSGGQSRALMIADTAILSTSPIILIDEIENAGIDRKKALELLVGEEKIVLMATHDPILALMGDKRIVIKNGGISKIMNVTQEEKSILSRLEEMDKVMQGMRQKLRYGETISLDKLD